MQNEAPKAQVQDNLPESLRKLIDVLATGASNLEAGRKLGIALRTVELRRSQLSKRLGATSAFQLGYLAAKLEQRQQCD